jgi:putative membrane protein
MTPVSRREPLVLLIVGGCLLALSRYRPHDAFTWWLEVAPILIVVPILLATARRFPLSPLVYRLIFLHALVLMVGGHYTYAEVPFGFWLRDVFHFSRNHYDRIGHFMQGFVPAVVAREVLLRRSPFADVPRSRWLGWVIVAFCLGASAAYELVEWLAAVTTADGATAFLGTQGDPWDTQMDMLMCLIGSVCAWFGMRQLHDRSLEGVLPRR